MAKGQDYIEMPPITGLPEGTKESGNRVDFRPKLFDLAHETKGYRIGWARATICPCKPINLQTEQPSPNCEICSGRGWVYFRPVGYVPPADIGELTKFQKNIILREKAVVVRALITSVTRKTDPFTQLGQWLTGTVNVTMRGENRMGYYDRIVNLDGRMAHSEIATQPTTPTGGTAQNLKLRYPAICVNLILDENGNRLNETQDFTISDTGQVVWVAGRAPADGIRLSVHYLANPVYLVMEHDHLVRETPIKSKNPNPRTPRGDPTQLPVKSIAKLEFLVSEGDREAPEV